MGEHPGGHPGGHPDEHWADLTSPCAHLRVGAAGVVEAVNDTFVAWTGWAPEEVLGTTVTSLLTVADRVLHATYVVPQLAMNGLMEHFACHVLGPDGTRHPVRMSARTIPADRGGGAHVVLTRAPRVDDVQDKLVSTVRHAEHLRALHADSEAERAREASHDSLTGLLNRSGLLHDLDTRAAGGPFGVLVVNLDRFRAVNDALGHDAGDALLRTVADRLTENLRAGSSVARTGADEFVVVDHLSRPAHVRALATRLLDLVAQPCTVAGVEVVCTASVGVALSEPDVDPRDLLRQAAAAVQRAKDRGRHRWQVHDPTSTAGALDRLRLVGQLRHAIAHDELHLVYQPRVDLLTRRTVGAEALVRWDHPQLGPTSPADFIPAAEESGLIIPLGRAVLRAAAAQAARWAGARDTPLEVSVNLSPRQLSDPGLVGHVAEALADHDLEPHVITLEITETALMDDPRSAIRTLHRLKDLGVRLAVDDFGTGYASLTYLRTLPLDELKIDRTFVAGLTSSPQDRAIVSGCLHLAHGVGLRTVAEGVEKPQEHRILTELGCQQGQGYWYARPGPAADVDGGTGCTGGTVTPPAAVGAGAADACRR